jgi:hypothetical protein
MILRAIVLILMAAAAVAVPILLLARFDGRPMSQVWIMSLAICSYIYFFLLLCMWRGCWLFFFAEFARLSYGPMLAFLSATATGSTTTAVFVLLFSMVWAAGSLGYSLAVHRLQLKGAEQAIHTTSPSPSFPTRDDFKVLNFNLCIVAPFAVLVWTLATFLAATVEPPPDELCILLILSYIGWIHAAVWVLFVAAKMPVQVQGVLLQGHVPQLLPALVPWMLISPAICYVSVLLSVFCTLLLMLALVAFLWYDVAIYLHYFKTTTPWYAYFQAYITLTCLIHYLISVVNIHSN